MVEVVEVGSMCYEVSFLEKAYAKASQFMLVLT